MRKAEIFVHNVPAGLLTCDTQHYCFTYYDDYQGPPISLTMPVRKTPYEFDTFPPFFDGLLPEGIMLHSLLKIKKINQTDYFSQLLCVGDDLVGAITVKELK